jgi:hypothetical protein
VEEIEKDYSFDNKKSRRVNPYDENPNQNRNNRNSDNNKDAQLFQDASIRHLKSKR